MRAARDGARTRAIRPLRLATVLLPAALLLHEGAYAIVGGSDRGAHGYLALALPLIAALAASLALASILLPAIAGSREPERWAPFGIAGALLGIFVAQEATEALLLGGGWDGAAASAAASWLAPPLALLLGALGSAFVISLAAVAEVVFQLVGWRQGHGTTIEGLPPSAAPFMLAACAGLGFGFARRPPPRHP